MRRVVTDACACYLFLDFAGELRSFDKNLDNVMEIQ